MAGRKPETFTDQENAALRDALKAYRAERRLSQTAMGELLGGTGQQSVGTWERGGGFGKPNADALARLLGFTDATAFLRDAGALANPMTVPQGWGDRELAVSIARRLKYEEEVIRRVVVKFQDDQYKSRTARWWNDRIVIEAAEYAATRGTTPDTTAPVAARPPKATPTSKEPRRRKAG